MGVVLPNVKVISGRTYFCRKVRGKQHYIRLPEITAANFPAALAKARRKLGLVEEGARAADGTFDQLIEMYRASSDYRANLTPQTQANYDLYLDIIQKRMGAAPVAKLRTSMIERMRDEMIATPGKANNWLKVLSTLLNLAVRRDIVTTNAADGVGKLKIGEHQPWPQTVLDAVLVAAPPVTRLAIQTGLYSGQRIGDCIKITHKMMEGDTVHLVQSKKRSKGDRQVEVFIPIHPDWKACVAAVPKRADTILYDRSGKPFRNPEALQERVRDLMKALGFVDGAGQALYTFHGLRKNSSNFLAEMGLSPHEIGAINGMTGETVAHYTKGVSKRRLAEASRDRMHRSNPVSGLREGENGVTSAS